MPRNASGVYSLPESPFVDGTTIESTPMNSNLSDIADALTLSLATSGVSSMSGPVKAATGAATAPSYTFAASQGTGFFLNAADEIGWAANGVLRGLFGSTGTVTFTTLSLSGDLTVTGSAGFSSDVGIGGDLGILGTIFLANGSVTGPSYSFVGNAGTGLYISATNEMSIANASVQTAVFRASGSVSFIRGISVAGDIEVAGSLVTTQLFPGSIIGIIKDVKTTASGGQALGTNVVRNLNTLEFSRNSLVALTTASSSFTVQPGSYFIEWIAPTFYNNGVPNTTSSFLVRTTTSVTLAYSIPSGTGTNDDGSTDFTFGRVVTTATVTATFHLYHHSDNASVSGGKANGVYPSVFTTVTLFAA